jgi:hypothetical protein
MDDSPGFSTSFRVLRGSGGQWEVVEDGHNEALASFDAPQAALSFACSVAEARHGSLVVVFDQPRRRAMASPMPLVPRTASAATAEART